MPNRGSFLLICVTICAGFSLAALTVVYTYSHNERAPFGTDVADEESMPLTQMSTVHKLRDMVDNLESTIAGKPIGRWSSLVSKSNPANVVKRLNSLLPMYFKRDQARSASDDGNTNVLRLLLLTKSAPGNFDKRLQTRQTWLSLAIQSSSCRCSMHTGGRCTRFSRLCQYRHLLWFHRFLVGMDNEDVNLMSTVIKDGMEHLDMLWFPEEDHYRRLTWKVHWAMQWVVENLALDYLMFVDDDSFMHLPHLAIYLSSAPRTRLYGGRIPYNDALVVRNKRSKWYVKEDAFPGECYPRYVWGAGLIMSTDVVSLFVERSHSQPVWFSVDDAFIGLVLNISGLAPTNIEAIYPAMSVFHGCDPGADKQPPILISSIDESHRKALNDYAMGSMSLCSLLVGPTWWKVTSFIQSYSFVLIVVVLVLVFCRPLVQRRYLFRLVVYV